MIVLLITLWSLCAIYFTHLFSKKKMKTAAVLLAVLYLYIVIWIYLLLFIDVGGVGFNLTILHSNSIRYGEIYRAFNEVAVKMNQLSDQFLVSLTMISIIVAFCSILVVIVGSIRITREIQRIISNMMRSTRLLSRDYFVDIKKRSSKMICVVPLIRMHCRANC